MQAFIIRDVVSWLPFNVSSYLQPGGQNGFDMLLVFCIWDNKQHLKQLLLLLYIVLFLTSLMHAGFSRPQLCFIYTSCMVKTGFNTFGSDSLNMTWECSPGYHGNVSAQKWNWQAKVELSCRNTNLGRFSKIALVPFFSTRWIRRPCVESFAADVRLK